MLPNNWDIYKIIDTFFEAVENYTVAKPAHNNTVFSIHSTIAEQSYKMILHASGKIISFYPYFRDLLKCL